MIDRTKTILDIEALNNIKQIFGERFEFAIEQYIKNSEENIQLIVEAIQTQDIKTLHRIAHTLKGISAQFGAIEPYKITKQMEQFANDGKFSEVKSLLAQLVPAQKEASTLLRQHLQNLN